jgi:hypothetical protein
MTLSQTVVSINVVEGPKESKKSEGYQNEDGVLLTAAPSNIVEGAVSWSMVISVFISQSRASLSLCNVSHLS